MDSRESMMKLMEAKDLLTEALELVDEATKATRARAVAESYTIPMIENILGEGNPYTSGTIEQLIEAVLGEGDYADEDLMDEYDDDEDIPIDMELEDDGVDPDDDFE